MESDVLDTRVLQVFFPLSADWGGEYSSYGGGHEHELRVRCPWI